MAVRMITAHQDHGFSSDADIIPDIQLIHFPAEQPVAADFIAL